jgi:hypothetical protein
MRRTIVWLAPVLLLAVAGSALAAAKSKHKVTATAVSVRLAQTGTPPLAGSTVTVVETVRSNPGGDGAGVIRSTYTGPTGAPATFGLRGTRTVYLAHGSFSGKLKGTVTIKSDGSLKDAGTETVSGGTDLYRGAKGKLTYTGTSPGVGKPTTLHFRGTVTY